MNLFEICNNDENHLFYKKLEGENYVRYLDFLNSLITTALQINHTSLNESIIKSINYHAIACLHPEAGEYRSINVKVGYYVPPDFLIVPQLMNQFINHVNNIWTQTDQITLAAFVLWRLNWIHPFRNGNGRTARALCNYVLSIKCQQHLVGLPQLIKLHRNEYVNALKQVDASVSNNLVNVNPLIKFIQKLLEQQL